MAVNRMRPETAAVFVPEVFHDEPRQAGDVRPFQSFKQMPPAIRVQLAVGKNIKSCILNVLEIFVSRKGFLPKRRNADLLLIKAGGIVCFPAGDLLAMIKAKPQFFFDMIQRFFRAMLIFEDRLTVQDFFDLRGVAVAAYP